MTGSNKLLQIPPSSASSDTKIAQKQIAREEQTLYGERTRLELRQPREFSVYSHPMLNIALGQVGEGWR